MNRDDLTIIMAATMFSVALLLVVCNELNA
jgi:hypothetical protein